MDENGVKHTVYGMEVHQNGRVMRAIADIFFDKKRALHFVELCNRLQLDPIHLDDVIEDILSM